MLCFSCVCVSHRLSPDGWTGRMDGGEHVMWAYCCLIDYAIIWLQFAGKLVLGPLMLSMCITELASH